MGKWLRAIAIINNPDIARGYALGQEARRNRDAKEQKRRRREKQRQVQRDTKGRFSGSSR